MLFINRDTTDPFFNIAAEEYFLKNFDEEFFMLWQNDKSIVVGKHQNTIREINSSYVHKNNIPVIRRITGGGTVYHDEGNLNFTFITNSDKRETLVDFTRATKPLIEYLETLGVKASFTGKNNITVDGKKISGNSAHVFKNRVIHHGTILINSNLEELDLAILEGKYKITDKAVQSVRANVINLNDILEQKLKVSEFRRGFSRFVKERFGIAKEYTLSEADIKNINELNNYKYNTWEWNYGYSPSFTIENKIGHLFLYMEVTKGIISKIDVDGNIEGSSLIPALLLNLPFDRNQIDNCFSSLDLSNKTRKRYFKLMGLGGK